MASIFGDESADEAGQRVFALAGLVGTEEQWDALVDKWLIATGGKEFHAAEWETEYAYDPDREKHKANLRIYAELTQLIAGSGLHGCGVGIDLAGYRQFFPHITQDYAYHKCFLETANRLVLKATKIGYSDLKFTFDHRQGEQNTGVLYDWMTKLPEWRETGIFFDNEISFSSRKNPRIQIADLVARETMKGLDNILSGERPMRKSLVALATADDRLQFDYLMHEYFEDLQKNMPALAESQGMSEEKYWEWLRQHKIQDNLGSRHRYLTWLDAAELRNNRESKQRIRELRQDHARPHPRSTQRYKSRSGRRKG